MNTNTMQPMLNIAKIHVKRLSYALDKLAPIFPITQEKVLNLSDEEIPLLELLTNRFSKLQDFMGNKLFGLFLEEVGESTEGLTVIDKINKLEKLDVIPNADLWTEMRRLRNHLSHEYPDHPELTAEYLNQTYTLAPELISCLHKIIHKLNSSFS